MNVLMASAEAAPFAKVGGLGDVLGSLPSALALHSIDVRVVLPAYGTIDPHRYEIEHQFSFAAEDRHGPMDVEVYRTMRNEIIFYFLSVWPFIGNEDSVYSVRDWDIPRFIIFNNAVKHLLEELHLRENWQVEWVHAHDWHMALLPFLVDQMRKQSKWTKLKSALSIHNIGYQGDNAGGWYWDRGIPERESDLLRDSHLSENQLAIGIAYADFITSVSPTYSREIQHPDFGHGLDGLLHQRKDDLYGILNGIDVELYSPGADCKIEYRYDAKIFAAQRQNNKKSLQRLSGLTQAPDCVLIGMVSRLVWQKGVDLALPALRSLLADSDIQLVILGEGDKILAGEVRSLANDFPWKVHARLEFDEVFAQQIYAGCDVFLMPSRFEPCGIGQMIAMRYGALPVVRDTGGLSDTVTNYDNATGESGTGFMFLWEQPIAIERTLRWVQKTFHEQPAAWKRMQKRAMEEDFSWQRSAAQYANLFEHYSMEQDE